MAKNILNDQDVAQLTKHGITVEEAQRQIALLREPPPWVELDRPCTLGDGIVQLTSDEQKRCIELGVKSASEGRVTKFVPASGAASRMFKDFNAALNQYGELSEEALRKLAENGDEVAKNVVVFWENREEFAFYDDLLKACGADHSDMKTWLRTLIGSDGLNYASLPKGLVKFHAYDNHCRTAFEEHLAEGYAIAASSNHACQVHFTAPNTYQNRIEALLQSFADNHFTDASFEVTFSEQKPSTDTLAVDSQGKPMRNADSTLLLRPGGHGALIENLAAIDGDIVCIKNIDNIEPDWRREDSVRWQRILIGLLTQLQADLFRFASDLATEKRLVQAAREFMQQNFAVENPDSFSPDELAALVNRPVRVCGMVRNQGEPGGGPFWIKHSGKSSLQIVESAQVDHSAAVQHEIFSRSTHFNPVNLVCGLRNFAGEQYNLNQFIDKNAVFIADKSQNGSQLRALERPGLWNGAMAHWNTAFVEMPLVTFNPVKTVLDLLRDGHRAIA